MRRGLFLVFEGLDGSGKTCQTHLVANELKPHFSKVVVTREPGGCPSAEELRRVMMKHELSPLSELLLMSAARIEHVRLLLSPALREGALVICDRFVDSTYVYQGHVKDVPQAQIRYIQTAISPPRPDLVFFFPHRYKLETSDRLERVEQEKVLEGYRARKKRGWIEVPQGSEKEVTAFIRGHVLKRL